MELLLIRPAKLVHSGKKKAYPSSFVWYCPDCGASKNWNIYRTRMLMGKVNVKCQWCLQDFKLDKANVIEEITRTKDMKSII